MPNTTPRLALPYPLGADPPDGAGQIQSLANQLDSLVASDQQGTLAARPAAGVRGRYYFATDAGALYRDDGTAWVSLGVDVGDLKLSSRVNAHGGWIVADGRTLATGQYPALRQVLINDSLPFGADAGNPKIPDLRGRTPVGAGQGSGLSARAVGDSGGGEAATIERNQMWRHLTDEPAGPEWAFATATPGPQIYLAGGGATVHDNMQPFTVCQWFIFAGAAT
jgi:microcystin-dependent protein